ncbi:uncharacterized protein N7484_001249 [Penicillium longicatenatum]|uniref:uncharacterized protein n=1 Tax=Penicillium longicatenatum TaxID=1561947 RepID=UPI002548DB6A|nr:uncharacterized protein N7484_001249 [Penicillium longicatenatum]KAJ5657600.1 hypothetical protein N7484_001249 [Penicillium longicatenatum]
MSEIIREAEKVVHGHQHDTNNTGKGESHDSKLPNKLDSRIRTEHDDDTFLSQPNTVSRGVQTSGSIMTDESTGTYSTNVAKQIDQHASSGDDHYTPNNTTDARPARPTKQDTLVPSH